MKYLIFNVTVFLALGYLIIGGNTDKMGATLEQSVSKAKAQLEQQREPKPIIQKVVQPAPKPEPEVKPIAQPKPAPVNQKIVDAPKAPPPAPAPLPKPIEVAKPQVKKIPSRALEKEIIEVAKSPEAIIQNDAEDTVQDTLVDTKERSRQLRQLVADMEQMFAEKMTQ